MNKAVKHILKRLESELSEDFVYHSVDHTVSVINAVTRIAESEQISSEESEILLTAAAYHDSGFLLEYQNHEENSCLVASKLLPEFGFNSEQIRQICELIQATKIPQVAKSTLENILCDADLDYLIKDCYYAKTNLLFTEMKNFGVSMTDEEWLDKQIMFLENHEFWTAECRRIGNPIKASILDQLKANQTHPKV